MSTSLPYYRMFPKDFDGDENVRLMSMCELGLYIRCLNHSWINGSLPNDPKKIAKIVGEPLKNVKRSWPAVLKCFTENEKGTLENKRLEKERKYAIEKSTKSKKAIGSRYGLGFPIEGVLGSTDVLPRVRVRAESGSVSESESCSSAVSVEGGLGESDFDLEDDIGTFLQNSSRRLRGPRIKLGRKQDEQITERLIAAESKHGSGEFRAAWLTFLPYCKENSIESPIGYFLASLERWLIETNAPAPETFEIREPQTTSPIETLPALTWQSDQEYQGYLGKAAMRGRRMTEPECEAGYPLFFPLGPEDRRKSTDDYAYVADNASAPKYIPSPVNHLKARPWKNFRIDVTPQRKLTQGEINQQEAWRILQERKAQREAAGVLQ